MSTSSTDSPYQPTTQLTDNELSADESADLNEIYSNEKPLDLTFNIQDYEIALSQQAYLHFQQIQAHAHQHQTPTRHHKFTTLLESAVRTNQDPAILEDTVHRWMSHQP
jgi:hypothetical protein